MRHGHDQQRTNVPQSRPRMTVKDVLCIALVIALISIEWWPA